MNDITPKASTIPVLDPSVLINALLERIKLIIGVVLLSLIIGYTYLSFQQPQYTATAMLQLNTSSLPVFEADSLVIAGGDDKAAIQSELDILRSPELAQRVVDALALQTKAEFNPNYKAAKKDGATLDERQTVRLLKEIQSRLSLRKDPLSYTVRVSFTSVEPGRARNIANAYTQEYLSYQVESRENLSRETNAWLTKRVAELRKNVIESERAVQVFSEDNDLFELNGRTLDDQQISELNSRLVEARSEYAQSEARLALAQKMMTSRSGVNSIPEVLDSYLIQRLREQEANLLRRKSELSGHFGPLHPTMQSITSELGDLRGKISSEIRKIVQGLENELEVAQARIDSLEGNLTGMRGQLGESTKQGVKLADLQREADANKQLYEGFLNRLKETGEAISLEQTNAKVIAKAQLPLNPSKPNKKLIMIFFFMLGGFIGTSIALILEYFNRGYASPKAIEDSLGVENIGMVPEIPESRQKTLSEFAKENVNSVYTESLRRILANLQFTSQAENPRSVLVLSSLPQEGKGWLSTSLSCVLAQTQKKVLLLDCDLHKKSIGDVLGIETRAPLNEYLAGNVSLEDIIQSDDASGLHFIGSVATHENVQTLIESDAMKALMDYAHSHYDLVIVDAPPVIGLSDVFYLSGLVDSCIFLVQWARTPKHVVQHALKTLQKAKVTLIGTVLTRVDMDQYRRHEFGSGYLYKKYGEYYQDLGEFNVSMADKVKSKIIKFKSNS